MSGASYGSVHVARNARALLGTVLHFRAAAAVQLLTVLCNNNSDSTEAPLDLSKINCAAFQAFCRPFHVSVGCVRGLKATFTRDNPHPPGTFCTVRTAPSFEVVTFYGPQLLVPPSLYIYGTHSLCCRARQLFKNPIGSHDAR